MTTPSKCPICEKEQLRKGLCNECLLTVKICPRCKKERNHNYYFLEYCYDCITAYYELIDIINEPLEYMQLKTGKKQHTQVYKSWDDAQELHNISNYRELYMLEIWTKTRVFKLVDVNEGYDFKLISMNRNPPP